MPITSANLPLFLPSVVGTSLTAPTNIGGATTATAITGGSIGELLFAMAGNAFGGADKIQYQKFFQGNTHGSLALTDAVIWIHNGMADSAGGYVTTAVSTSALDGSGKYLRVIGNDATADAQDEIDMAGTTTATGTIVFNKRWVVTLHDGVTDALTPSAGTITIYENGVAIAIIPPGAYSCTGEVKIGLKNALNDTDTTTDASTAPTGITFSRPRTVATGLAVANSGSLTAGAEQGGWIEWTCNDGRRASNDVEVYILCEGTTA